MNANEPSRSAGACAARELAATSRAAATKTVRIWRRRSGRSCGPTPFRTPERPHSAIPDANPPVHGHHTKATKVARIRQEPDGECHPALGHRGKTLLLIGRHQYFPFPLNFLRRVAVPINEHVVSYHAPLPQHPPRFDSPASAPSLEPAAFRSGSLTDGTRNPFPSPLPVRKWVFHFSRPPPSNFLANASARLTWRHPERFPIAHPNRQLKLSPRCPWNSRPAT